MEFMPQRLSLFCDQRLFKVFFLTSFAAKEFYYFLVGEHYWPFPTQKLSDQFIYISLSLELGQNINNLRDNW
jgi:hypothetical protein